MPLRCSLTINALFSNSHELENGKEGREKMPTIAEFLCLFKFNKDLAGFIGIEREHFLAAQGGILVPKSKEFLNTIADPRWTYELSACQVEDRTNPQRDLSAVKLELLENDNNGRAVAEKLGLCLVNLEVAPDDMPLDVYPLPRYLKIAKWISDAQLLAACQVTGTHLHFGVKNLEEAIELHNKLIPHLEELCRLGDHSAGRRLAKYKEMAKNWMPRPYCCRHDFYETAIAQGFSDNPKNCWHLIRISAHGTVELRMFGVTDNLDDIIFWIEAAKLAAGR